MCCKHCVYNLQWPVLVSHTFNLICFARLSYAVCSANSGMNNYPTLEGARKVITNLRFEGWKLKKNLGAIMIELYRYVFDVESKGLYHVCCLLSGGSDKPGTGFLIALLLYSPSVSNSLILKLICHAIILCNLNVVWISFAEEAVGCKIPQASKWYWSSFIVAAYVSVV